jgi:hypothetical protein
MQRVESETSSQQRRANKATHWSDAIWLQKEANFLLRFWSVRFSCPLLRLTIGIK